MSNAPVRATWRILLPLWLLCAIPIVAGIARLIELGRGAAITPDNARFMNAPLPIVAHIVGATLFVVLGASQFAPSLRARSPVWHRRIGWLLVACALVAPLSGLWLQTFHPTPEPTHPALLVFRWLFGSALVAFLALGVRAALRREFAQHGAFMLRAYAIALGAGTQSLLLFPWFVLLGPPAPLPSALVMGASWLLNLSIAEWIIRARQGGAPTATSLLSARPALSYRR